MTSGKNYSLEELELENVRRDSYATMLYLTGNKYEPMHDEWHRNWKNNRLSATEAAVGHLKTTNVVYDIVHTIGYEYFNKFLTLKIFTSSLKNSMDRVKMAREIINTPEYKYLFPHVKPDPKSFGSQQLNFIRPFTIQQNAVLEGLGFEGKWTGIRGTKMYCDDITDFEIAISIAESDKQIKKFETDLFNRLMSESRLIMIYTPQTEWDLSQHIKNKKLMPIFSYNYMNFDNDRKSLLPSIWTPEALEKKKNEMPEAWKVGNLLIPIHSEAMRIFFREDFYLIDPPNFNAKRPDLSLDFATGSGLDNQSYAIIFNLGDLKYFHDIQTFDVKMDLFFNIIDDLDKQYNFGKIYFESNATQKSFGDLFPKSFKYKTKGNPTTKSKKEDLQLGLRAMAGQMRNRKIAFNKHIKEHIIKEFISYPFQTKDDAVMSAWMGWYAECQKIERVVL